jgi:predicted amidohydrolase YtcJ
MPLRESWLAVAAAALAIVAWMSPTIANAATGGEELPPEAADTVFTNGAVYTADAARSWATAVAVRGERIVYVGDDATARRHIGKATRVIDLAGRMLLPGFQDSHVHPALAPNPATQLDVGGLKSEQEIVAQVRRHAAAHPGKPWIVGTGWAESAFLPSGQPTRAVLDAAVPDRPAFLTNNSQHMGWANSRALALAGIDADTPDPANGRIERDDAGRPTGVLQEAAMDLVRQVIPPPSVEEQGENLLAAMREMQRHGVTAFEEAAARPGFIDAYAALARADRIEMRARICQWFDPAGDDTAQLQVAVHWRETFAATKVDAGCVKIVLDGAYGSHTVALQEPYHDEPERFGNGKLFVDPERLRRVVTQLDAAGFQVHVHALGDGAVRAALDAFEAARTANGLRDSRHTLAHLALIDDGDLRRFRELGVVANMSPVWNRPDPWETVFAPRMFGPERSAKLYRTRSLLDAGVVLVWGSDWPVTGVDALDGIETATTRRYPGGRTPEGAVDASWIPEQRVTLPEAITAYTAAGAYLLHAENVRGTIATGKLADLVVLSGNLFAVPPLAIHALDVDLTMIGGKPVFERER